MSVGAYTAANLIVRLGMPFWVAIPAGGLMAALIGIDRRHPVAAHQGDLSGDRHPGGAADHRVDDQSRPVDLGRRAGLDRDPAPVAFRSSRSSSEASIYLFLMFFVVLAIVGYPEPGAQPHRPRLHRHPRPGHRRRDHRHQHLPLQALRVRDLVVLCRGGRRAGKLLSRDRQLRAVPARRLDRLSGDGDHRRPRLGAGLDLRRHLRHLAADRNPLGSAIVRRPVLLAGAISPTWSPICGW